MNKFRRWLIEKQNLSRHQELKNLGAGESYISISFDDFPVTAATNGAEILEKYDMRGVFFLSGSLAGQQSVCGQIATVRDAENLASRGHEIGSHSFSHVRPFTQGADAFENDLAMNSAFLNNMDIQEVTSFSYPYGECKSQFKSLCKEMFQFSRGIRPGINPPSFDSAYLKANKLYAQLYDFQNFKKLIDETISMGGWLILYTHDVDVKCSPYGCTPQQLEEVVSYAASAGIKPTTFRQMYERLLPVV